MYESQPLEAQRLQLLKYMPATNIYTRTPRNVQNGAPLGIAFVLLFRDPFLCSFGTDMYDIMGKREFVFCETKPTAKMYADLLMALVVSCEQMVW